MSINNINQATYTSDEGVATYKTNSLQNAEVTIFVHYKEYYYNKNVLDIGCGAGRTSYYFRNFTKQYIGLDYSESMIKYCQSEYPELSFNHADARDLSNFKNNNFDFVMFSYNGLDYITDKDRKTVFNEVKRVLKREGLFVFSTHNRNYNHIPLKPEFELSLNPINFIRNFLDYVKQIQKNNKLKYQQIENNDYAILNDSGNGFSLLTYYITKEKQVEQLNNAGFEVLEIVDMAGQSIELNTDDSQDAWLYFITRIKES